MIDAHLKDKTVFIRVDFNVPMDDEGHITDDTRIRNALPTLQSAVDAGTKVVLASHLGRPQKDKDEQGRIQRTKYSMSPVATYLGQLIEAPVLFIDDTVGASVHHAIEALASGEILLLENTRFYTEEKKSDPAFSKQLADLADYYINDAFGTAHRDHATTAGMARLFSSDSKSFGLLMDRELAQADRLLSQPEQPFVAILGGAKVSDKIELIEQLLHRVQHIVIGGGMAFTFIKALGGEIGNSLLEEDKIALATSLMDKAKRQGVTIHLPVDAACATAFEDVTEPAIYPADRIPDGHMGLDIGPDSIANAQQVIARAKTIFWNGPMGVFEFSGFAKGSYAVAQAVADATQEGAYSMIGGGDSVAAIEQSGLADQVSFISTGGGAMLTLLEGGVMPAIDAMQDITR